MEPSSWNEANARTYFGRYLRLQTEYDVKLKRALENASRAAQKLVRTLPNETFSQGVRTAMYRQRYAAINEVMVDLWGKTGDTINSGIRAAAKLGAQSVVTLANALSASGSGVLIDGFREAALRSVTNVQSRFINQINLSSAVYKNQALSMGYVDQRINNGILLGKSAREIANDVRILISARAPGGVSYSAMRLGRTELNNAFHTTQTRSYAEQPWVTGVKWVTSGSHPRPDICDEYATQDGFDLGPGVFDRRNVPGKPHPQCLCHIIAITISREDFIDALVAGDYSRYLHR